MNIKQEINNSIGLKFDEVDLSELIMESISPEKGDYCLPCFSFAKILKENPMNVANKIKDSVNTSGIVERCEVVAGYVNFFLNKSAVTKQVLEDFSTSNFMSDEGKGKIICVDYGSPNLAKYLHIGHLKTLIIGESLCRMFASRGYTVKRLNFIGDYGTPFGKIIGGLQKWGSVEEIEKRGNDALQEYYVKFNQMEEKDETYSQLARDIFKKIEQKDAETYEIYKKIIEISLEDAKKQFKILGVDFDDYRGEMFYSQFVPEFINKLKEKNLLVESEGAQIVDLSKFDMPSKVMIKNDGTSLYATRDLAAVVERNKEYHFDKMIYVTDVAQSLNFQQNFKIVELMGYDFASKLEHVPYGRFSLPDGKISSRRGKQAVLVDLIEVAENKAKDVIKDRKFEIENPEDVVKKVAKAVLNYSVLKVERNKDCVFDVDKSFTFDGETAPYMLYTYTRLESILRKYKEANVCADHSWIETDGFSLVKSINNFKSTIDTAIEKRDVSFVAKRIMEMCKTFNHLYTNCKILDDNISTTKAKVLLVEALKDTIAFGFNLICIDPLKEM